MTNEQEIIDHIKQGDSEAYQQIVERYHIGLIIHCENIIKDREEAEDIAQEAFLTAYQKLARYDARKAQFSTWLYRIATNKCLDKLRRTHTHLDIDTIESIALVTMPTHIEDDESRRLRELVLELTPPEHRRVIEAYFWEGKTYKQIAAELDTTTGTVGVWIMRAKQQLKEVLS